MYTRLVALAAVLLVAACNESPTPTGLSPELAISDAAHDDGNEHFFFLRPMVPNPSPTGTFDGDQEPVVEICVWDGSDCGASLELYTMETGSGSETIRVDLDAEHYVVNWHTDAILASFPIDVSAGESYRIRVLVGAQVLGYADVEVVDNGKQLKNVDTEEYIPLLDGRTLPIKFRIEEGALDVGGDVVDAGARHTCALQGGVAYCWGWNIQGQLGRGTVSNSELTPAPVLGGHTFQSLSLGFFHTCGITTDGDAYCWGTNIRGETGDGTSFLKDGIPHDRKLTPVLVTGGHTWTELTAGLSHTCGITNAGDMYCWGWNGFGQLGTGVVTLNHETPQLVTGAHSFSSTAAGFRHTCGLRTDGAAYCWGLNAEGQVGDGTFTNRLAPAAVVGGHIFQSVSGNALHNCGIRSDGAAYCWGWNFWGQVGDGSTDRRRGKSTPVAVSGGHVFQSLGLGNNQSCGVRTDGVAYCWGANHFGQLGDGTTTHSTTPVAVTGGHSFQSVTGGLQHSCGATTDGDAYCWGGNSQGELGDGTSVAKSSPVFVIDLDPPTL